jgi:hypothetical protein
MAYSEMDSSASPLERDGVGTGAGAPGLEPGEEVFGGFGGAETVDPGDVTAAVMNAKNGWILE